MNTKLLSFVMLIGLAGSVCSQIERNTWTAGGNFLTSYNSSETSSSEINTTTLGIQPRVAKFVSQNLALGLNLSLDYSKSTSKFDNQPDWKRTSTLYGVRPFVRYYNMLSDRVGLFGEAGVSYATGQEKTAGVKADLTQWVTDIRPGLVFFPTKRIGLEATFGLGNYARMTRDPQTGEKSTTDNFVFSFDFASVGVGLQFYFD